MRAHEFIIETGDGTDNTTEIHQEKSKFNNSKEKKERLKTIKNNAIQFLKQSKKDEICKK
jgi:hypothetical protein